MHASSEAERFSTPLFEAFNSGNHFDRVLGIAAKMIRDHPTAEGVPNAVDNMPSLFLHVGTLGWSGLVDRSLNCRLSRCVDWHVHLFREVPILLE